MTSPPGVPREVFAVQDCIPKRVSFSCSGGLKLLITVSFLVVFTKTFSNFAVKLDIGIDYCFKSFL